MVWLGVAVKSGMSGLGMVRLGLVGLGTAWQTRRGLGWCGAARLCKARQSSLGTVRFGRSKVWRAKVWRGLVLRLGPTGLKTLTFYGA